MNLTLCARFGERQSMQKGDVIDPTQSQGQFG
jgi:hypothetical protein